MRRDKHRASRPIADYFSAYAWGVLGFNLAVILWGAFVRATGSGAGCGSRWPSCNGQVIPRSPELETIIEFTHRASSGVLLLLVAGLVIGAFRFFPKGHLVRLGAVLAGCFLVLEAFLGASLVLFGWVTTNDSVARVVVMGVHLVNTLLLTAWLTLTAWWATYPDQRLELSSHRRTFTLLVIGLAGVLVLAISGAIAALGDTLFPASSLFEGLSQDVSPGAHLLLRLRTLHPLIAVLVGLYVGIFMFRLQSSHSSLQTASLARSVLSLVILQLALGALNVILLAPVWMQIVHLLVADLIWIALVLTSVSALSRTIQAPASR